jgi:hypothetical protein
MHSNLVDIIAEMVRREGMSCVDNQERLAGLVADALMNRYYEEERVLKATIRAGAVDELVRNKGHARRALEARLCSDEGGMPGLTKEEARWAVAVWARALESRLGTMAPRATSAKSTGSPPRPTAASKPPTPPTRRNNASPQPAQTNSHPTPKPRANRPNTPTSQPPPRPRPAAGPGTTGPRPSHTRAPVQTGAAGIGRRWIFAAAALTVIFLGLSLWVAKANANANGLLDQAVESLGQAKYAQAAKDAQEANSLFSGRKTEVMRRIADGWEAGLGQMTNDGKLDSAGQECKTAIASFPEDERFKALGQRIKTLQYVRVVNACMSKGDYAQAVDECVNMMDRLPQGRESLAARDGLLAELMKKSQGVNTPEKLAGGLVYARLASRLDSSNEMVRNNLAAMERDEDMRQVAVKARDMAEANLESARKSGEHEPEAYAVVALMVKTAGENYQHMAFESASVTWQAAAARAKKLETETSQTQKEKKQAMEALEAAQVQAGKMPREGVAQTKTVWQVGQGLTDMGHQAMSEGKFVKAKEYYELARKEFADAARTAGVK